MGRNRAQLQELDQLLDALERLNLSGEDRLPPTVRSRLEVFGIRVPSRPDVTNLIEQVWEIQEQYLTPEDGRNSTG